MAKREVDIIAYLSDVSKVMIDTLIERKQEEKRIGKLKWRWSLTTFVCLGLTLLYIYFGKLQTGGYRVDLSFLFGDVLLLLLGSVLLFCLFQVQFYAKKHQKSEKEFESLREEVIERTPELWGNEDQWNHRYDVFEGLKTHYDINLYHK